MAEAPLEAPDHLRVLAAAAACVLALIGATAGDVRAENKRAALAAELANDAADHDAQRARAAAFIQTQQQQPVASAKSPPSPLSGVGGHHSHASVRAGATATSGSGKLPSEVIGRVIRQNLGRYRLCYEAGQKSNPTLAGRIATKLVIGRDGSVMQASDGSATLPDQGVVACVTRSYLALSFPAPEGGIVMVTQVLDFLP